MSEDSVEVQTVELSAVESEARKFGWVPQEEFSGDPSQWRDAEAFLQRGKEINGFLRKDLKKLTDHNSKLEAELLELRETMKQFAEFHKETEIRAYERAKLELREQKKTAIAEGDGDRVVEIDEQLDKLKAIDPSKIEVKSPKQEEIKELPKEFVDWNEKNSWYTAGGEDELSVYADGYAQRLRITKPKLIGPEFLEEISRKVKETFPNKFGKRQPNVDGAGDTVRVSTPGGKKSYKDLPPEAKKACDKYVKEGLLKEEEYIKQYFSE